MPSPALFLLIDGSEFSENRIGRDESSPRRRSPREYAEQTQCQETTSRVFATVPFSDTTQDPRKTSALQADGDDPDGSPDPAAINLRIGTAWRFAHAWAFDRHDSPSHVHARQMSRSTADAVAASRIVMGCSARSAWTFLTEIQTPEPQDSGVAMQSIFCLVYRAAIARPSCASANPGWSCSARRKLSLARDRSPSRRYVQPRPLCRPAQPGCAATPF
jgi:hypothetical protein